MAPAGFAGDRVHVEDIVPAGYPAQRGYVRHRLTSPSQTLVNSPKQSICGVGSIDTMDLNIREPQLRTTQRHHFARSAPRNERGVCGLLARIHDQLCWMSGLSLLLPDYVDRDLQRRNRSSVLKPV